jgi:hypothetical protein
MRQGTSTLATSTLVLLDGRSIYLRLLRPCLCGIWFRATPADLKQIEVVRGPRVRSLGRERPDRCGEHPDQDAHAKNPSTSVNFSAGTFGTKGGSREGSSDHYMFGAGISFAKAIVNSGLW